jgi:hypothetical protein
MEPCFIYLFMNPIASDLLVTAHIKFLSSDAYVFFSPPAFEL